MHSMVDWATAQRTATKLVKPGPEVSPETAAAAVDDLRGCAMRAEAYVRRVTGLSAPPGTAPVYVIDRPRWIEANVASFEQLLAPLTIRLAARKAGADSQPEDPAALPGPDGSEKLVAPAARSAIDGVGARVAGLELGALLSYLAPKVLGQFDPFATESGRLLLVAPNIVSAERELDLLPGDFRLWVCLHEETHRVQFTAVPWLREYLNSEIGNLLATADVDAAAMVQMLRNATVRIAEAARTGAELSIVDLVQTPEQREIVDRLTAVMSLLEGHADVVMDGVGPDVIGSVAEIRSRFNIRRQGQGFDKILRRLLGLDAKMRQYRDGAAFCQTVIAAVGMDGLNRVWDGPDRLPSKAEIADPQLWLDRMEALLLTGPGGE